MTPDWSRLLALVTNAPELPAHAVDGFVGRAAGSERMADLTEADRQLVRQAFDGLGVWIDIPPEAKRTLAELIG